MSYYRHRKHNRQIIRTVLKVKNMSHWLYLLVYVHAIHKCSFSVHLLNSFLFAIRNPLHSSRCSFVALSISSAEVATSGENVFNVGLQCKSRDQVYCSWVTGSDRTRCAVARKLWRTNSLRYLSTCFSGSWITVDRS